MINNTEVIAFEDRDRRNELFDELRKTGDQFERQVVKFSDYKEVVGQGGEKRSVSIWCVAYPKS